MRRRRKVYFTLSHAGKETFPPPNSSKKGKEKRSAQALEVGLEWSGRNSDAGIQHSFAPPARRVAGRKKEVFIMRIGRYESSESSHVGTAITFLLIGLGAGALAGLLLAPKSGKQTRRDLQRGFEDAKDTLGDWAETAKDRVREAGDRVRDVASKGVDLASDLNNDLREKVEPLRRAINRS
jgi:gas vesicle protein